jgi:hypothetical protein
MRPFPAEAMHMWPISTRVNKPGNDDSSIVEPIALANFGGVVELRATALARRTYCKTGASARRLRRRHRSGSQYHRPWTARRATILTALCVCEPHAAPRGHRTTNASIGFLGRFSPLLETEYLSDVADAGLRALAT